MHLDYTKVIILILWWRNFQLEYWRTFQLVSTITKDSEEFKELAGWMKKIGRSVEAATARIRPTIADEHYLQGEEVCELLHISKRTLQTLRDEGGIPYTTIGGKILYPESVLYETLRKNYRNYRRYAR